MTHATSFGAAAGDYQRGRPGYSADAVAWLLPSSPRRVLDLGAGTGKLTALVVEAAPDVVAIDPDPAMLETLAAALPQVATAVGTAESIPLPDASVDAVAVGQAWHWFDVDAASTEVARVLRPGGTLGLVWNIRDSREPWVARLGEAMRGSAAEQLIEGAGPRVGAALTGLEHATWEWARGMSADDVRAMARSRSHYIVGDDAYRAQVDRDVEAVLAGLPDRAGVVSLPYVTHAFRAHRP
ncbi:class I SAM-dependent methyltransferase [Demequina muriae]|uniref:Class I SAM-dependent methyltransferase n=1 Tax=Demequina muriae TaxID=3051664 RepID=A0ABT8GEY9_9MICO|nr:class I SAM-dependent methyltransferase [Demequina sp. EGI L300058]MDN4479997.1 class I SAM-dependent methyltransferase [Demequina sp. EGI L300058]